MAQFTLEQNQNRIAQRAERQANGGNTKTFATVGFFGSVLNADKSRTKYMTKSGDIALVRINYKDASEITTSTYHQIAHAKVGDADRNFMKVDCLGRGCPLCDAARPEDGKGNISKAKERVFVPMLVAYKKADGTFTPAEPVIWDLPANQRNNYAQLIANKLADFAGPLTEHVFKVTRSGTGFDTSYTIDYIPAFDNDKIVGKDFSAFDNFDVSKHSYWVKNADEINEFLTTSSFPATTTETAAPAAQPTQTVAQPTYTQPTQTAATTTKADQFTSPDVDPFGTPSTSATTNNFEGFSF